MGGGKSCSYSSPRIFRLHRPLRDRATLIRSAGNVVQRWEPNGGSKNSQAIVKNTHAARKNLHIISPAHCLRQKTVVVREIFVVRSATRRASQNTIRLEENADPAT